MTTTPTCYGYANGCDCQACQDREAAEMPAALQAATVKMCANVYGGEATR